MKCRACQRYMHKFHRAVVELDDGSAEVCDCERCRAGVAQSEEPSARNGQDAGANPAAGSDAPPPHPAPVDRGKYRIAEEPPGTDLTQPWLPTRCLECRDAIWARNERTVTKGEAICESCFYMMVSEHYDKLAEVRQQWRMTWRDPFAV